MATVTVDRFERRAADPAGGTSEIEAEAFALLALVLPDAADHRVRFVPRP